MDEPTHSQENLFWDQVADWLLDPPLPELFDEQGDAWPQGGESGSSPHARC